MHTHFPVLTSNTRIFLSRDPVAMNSLAYNSSFCISYSYLLVSIYIEVSYGLSSPSSFSSSSLLFSSTISPRSIFFFSSNYFFKLATFSFAVSLFEASILLSSSSTRDTLLSYICESSSANKSLF